MLDGLTIGDLAERCGLSRDTLRFYERERLLSPPRRSASGYRLYGETDAARVRFIRRAQATGLTLDDIRELLRVQQLRTPETRRRVAARPEPSHRCVALNAPTTRAGPSASAPASARW